MHGELQTVRNAIVNQMRAQFARHFPVFVDVVEDPGEDWATKLFAVVPDHAAAMKVRPSRIAAILKKHRIRRVDAEEVVAKFRGAPVHSAPGVAQAAIAHIALLAERVRLVNKQLKGCLAHLQSILHGLAAEPSSGQKGEPRDAAIIQTMPGIGVIGASTLLGEAAEPLRPRDYPALPSPVGCRAARAMPAERSSRGPGADASFAPW